MLKISWKDKVSNTDVLKRIGEKEPRFYRQKLTYAGYVIGLKRKCQCGTGKKN